MTYTEEQIQAAREYAAKPNLTIANEALTATYYADHITTEDRERIKQDNLKYVSEILAGKHDHNFTVWQRMHYYLTGESVALLG